jgi:hypothetical protein
VPILHDVCTDLVKVKRIAADIIATAVEAKVSNASLTIATRAAIDMTIFGSSVPKLLSSARTRGHVYLAWQAAELLSYSQLSSML